MGYAGGHTAHPTYHDLADHAETLQIDYDPAATSYAELLDGFWEGHAPTRSPWSRQYMSAIFCHDDEQMRLAEASREAASRRLGREIFTEILPADGFHLAEDYHQKYLLRRSPELMADFDAMYPDVAGFVASTAAARVNGYLGGWGTAASLAAEIDGLGLSDKARRILERRVARG